VELDAAGGGEHGAAARVEARMIFQRAYRRLDGVDRAAAAAENSPASRERLAHAGAQLLPAIGGIGAGATVDDQCRHAGSAGWLSSPHRAQRVTIRRRWPPSILWLGSTRVSFAAAGARVSSLTAKRRPPIRLGATAANATGRGRCRASATLTRGCPRSGWPRPP